MNTVSWYEDWFDSPYYHLLYNNRNHQEAEFFIDNLCTRLNLKSGAKIWDLACGKGRHAIAINRKGFDVTGTDLSENNVREARNFSNQHLRFKVHDMREPFDEKNFDAVFNLFTSIGYFDKREDNFRVFENVSSSLNEGGVFVIDFFNSEKVSCNLPASYNEKRNNLVFNIHKEAINGRIIKKINFHDKGRQFNFEEKVNLLTKKDFEEFGRNAGLKLNDIFGNYALEEFNENKSDRLILIFKK